MNISKGIWLVFSFRQKQSCQTPGWKKTHVPTPQKKQKHLFCKMDPKNVEQHFPSLRHFHLHVLAKKLNDWRACHMSRHRNLQGVRFGLEAPTYLGRELHFTQQLGRVLYIYIYIWRFPKMVVPPRHPKWSFLVGKPIVVGYHHLRKPLVLFLVGDPELNFHWVGG